MIREFGITCIGECHTHTSPLFTLARFSTCPKVQHGAAVKWLGWYLLGTRDKGIILTQDPTKGLELYVDADFAGAWDPKLAGKDIDTARSRHGYIIAYAGVPLLWKSSMQGRSL